MNLVRLGVGRWEVLVTEQVVEVLSDFSSAKGPKRAMLSFLHESVPMGGPQEGNRTVCKQLKPGSLKLSEFRKGQYPGTKIRVIWFYGDEATKLQIVCVRAFEKNSEETSLSEIRAAASLREQYLDARSRGSLKIEESS
jgi:Phage derived protein Gp49-like (DUF891)